MPTPFFLPPDGVSGADNFCFGPITDERPIPEDLNHCISTEPLSCDRLAYRAPALSTPHPTRPGFYFVGDAAHFTEEVGDIYGFFRQWANIPRSFSRPVGTYPYRFPGLPSGTSGTPVTITALSPSRGNQSSITPTCTTSGAHGFTVGQRLRLAINYASFPYNPAGGGVIVTAVPSSTTFTTTSFLLYLSTGPGGGGIDYGEFTSGTAALFAPSRDPKLIPADAVELYDFALPGVTPGIATAGDFRATPLFEAVDADVKDTDILSADTSPTAAAYRQAVDEGRYLVAESGVSIYRGQILQRRTLLVRYT